MCQLVPQYPSGRDCTPSKSIICTIDLDNTPILNADTDCYIDGCNRVYTICNISQSLFNSSDESSARCGELSSGGQTVHSNKQPINCTIVLIPNRMEFYLTCQKGECRHRATSNTTTCSRDLGIDCGGK